MSLDMECRWYEEHLAAAARSAATPAAAAATTAAAATARSALLGTDTTRHANTGGPMSRRRTERVLVSVLRDDASQIHLPRTLRAGLRFGDADPLTCVLAALARLGLDDPEQLRARYAAPARPLLCRVVPNAPWATDVASTHDDALVEQALLLGLCTPYQYDPARPVLWTRASLTRCVELYDAEGFYA